MEDLPSLLTSYTPSCAVSCAANPSSPTARTCGAYCEAGRYQDALNQALHPQMSTPIRFTPCCPLPARVVGAAYIDRSTTTSI